MNPSYPEVHAEHMSGASQRPSSGDRRFSYGQPPQLLQSQQPPPAYSHYPPQQYGYPPSGMAPQLPATTGMMPHPVHLPAMAGAPTGPLPGTQSQQPEMSFDHTGQVAPPGMKPRVTATLWEDEGTLCFQVEAKSVCVARREDNHMINGTKLLNVAGMTRGRRDGILKSEKTRHVVKIGPMHLKGVWIPFDRALEFANKEKITELLYPLFVHDIGSLLYHPSNQPRQSVGNATMTALDRSRRPDPMQNRGYIAPPASQPPGLHHHHSMSNPMTGPMPLNQMPQSSVPISQASHMQSHGGRPSLDRAHTFPTPPTSATVGPINGQGPSQDWSQSAYPSAGASQPLAVNTANGNPQTPATTPPGGVQQSMSYPTAAGYDNSRAMYSEPPSQQAQYNTQSQVPIDYQRNVYAPTDMAQPARPVDHVDSKPQESMIQQGSDPNAQPVEQGEGEHEQGNDYSHTSSSYNNANRNYTYGTANGTSAPLHSEHIAQDMTSSPHQTASGRQTPRTTATGGQPQWNTGYPNTQRSTASSYSMSNILGPQSGNPANGNPPAGSYQPSPSINQYSNQGYSTPNGVNPAKRGRDGDDQDHINRPDSGQGDEIERIKRRRTMEGGAVGPPTFANGPGLQRARTTMAGQGI